MDFAAFLKKHKCTKWKLAKHLNVPFRAVSNWCKGVGIPDSKQAIEISIFLRCNLTETYKAILNTPHRCS